MIETVIGFVIIIGLISVVYPPLGMIIIELLSMPIKIAFADMRIVRPLFGVLIVLLFLGKINI